MGFRKCPKCDLNYIRDDEKLCKVCSRSVKAVVVEEDVIDTLMCIECGEHPHVEGGELCVACLAEKKRLMALHDVSDNLHDIDPIDIVDDGDLVELDIEVPIARIKPSEDDEFAEDIEEQSDTDDEDDDEADEADD